MAEQRCWILMKRKIYNSSISRLPAKEKAAARNKDQEFQKKLAQGKHAVSTPKSTRRRPREQSPTLESPDNLASSGTEAPTPAKKRKRGGAPLVRRHVTPTMEGSKPIVDRAFRLDNVVDTSQKLQIKLSSHLDGAYTPNKQFKVKEGRHVDDIQQKAKFVVGAREKDIMTTTSTELVYRMKQELPREEDESVPVCPDPKSMDLKYRYWQWRIITELVSAEPDSNEATDVAPETLDNARSAKIDMNEGLAIQEEHMDDALLLQKMGQKMEEKEDTDLLNIGKPTKAERAEFVANGRLFDKAIYQKAEWLKALIRLRIESGKRPKLPGCSDGVELRWWQVCGVDHMCDLMLSEILRGCVLSDMFGLGKTYEFAALILHDMNERKIELSKMQAESTAGLFPPKDRREAKRPKTSRQRSESAPIGVIPKPSTPSHHAVITSPGPLHRDNPIFSPDDEATAHQVIITTYGTLSARHTGYDWKDRDLANKTKGTSIHNEEKELNDLSGLVRMAVADESQAIKGADTFPNFALRRLEADFYLLSSATPFFVGIADFLGYLRIMERAELSKRYRRGHKYAMEDGEVDFYFKAGSNPYVLPNDHPTAELKYTYAAFQTWVVNNPEISKDIGQGEQLEQMYSKCLIRRGYLSDCPVGDPNRIIGRELPPAFKTVANLQLSKTGQMLYEKIGAVYSKHMITMQEGSRGRMMINAAKFRALTFMTSCPLFAFCPSLLEDRFKYDENPVTDKAFALEYLRSLLREIRQSEIGRKLVLKLPKKGNVKGHLAPFIQYGPNLAAWLAHVADQVVKRKEKAIYWVTFPGQQVLLKACLSALEIRADAIMSNMTPKDRDSKINSFNSFAEGELDVLFFTLTCGSAGTNLQHNSCHCGFWDPPPSIATQQQCLGRQYRVDQLRTVYSLEFFVEDTINDKHDASFDLDAIKRWDQSQSHETAPLEPAQVLTYIQQANRGEVVQVEFAVEDFGSMKKMEFFAEVEKMTVEYAADLQKKDDDKRSERKKERQAALEQQKAAKARAKS
ncbi:hypothetical protein EJ08DRAFT_697366 [Tothia fuscella]|uniref:SNF2 N-terminal domain-containing protein n=1 Tax=Tothia fuscella TaxID=1048955 RepID=A0A9P4TYI7_9PEZI|nr:hypothetical protein EJ08DRAFT_697366 [Tothia fuscella]